jgi:hypothetical protein
MENPGVIAYNKLKDAKIERRREGIERRANRHG